MAKQRVFVDTNVIIEAFRTKCWDAICRKYSVETVASVVKEALAGDPDEPGYVVVDEQQLRTGLSAVHTVTPLMLAELAIRHKESEGLDVGERDLIAWLFAEGSMPEGLLLLSTADKAAIVVTGKLQWLDCLAALANLALDSGISHRQVDQIKDHHKAKWLDAVKMKVRLGVIP